MPLRNSLIVQLASELPTPPKQGSQAYAWSSTLQVHPVSRGAPEYGTLWACRRLSNAEVGTLRHSRNHIPCFKKGLLRSVQAPNARCWVSANPDRRSHALGDPACVSVVVKDLQNRTMVTHAGL